MRPEAAFQSILIHPAFMILEMTEMIINFTLNYLTVLVRLIMIRQFLINLFLIHFLQQL